MSGLHRGSLTFMLSPDCVPGWDGPVPATWNWREQSPGCGMGASQGWAFAPESWGGQRGEAGLRVPARGRVGGTLFLVWLPWEGLGGSWTWA